MKITDIHEVTIIYHVGEIVLEQKINDEYFQQMAIRKYMIEQSIYIAVSKSFLELAVRYYKIFSEKPLRFDFVYKDADNYKHIMSI